jgi:thymidylate synthase (FAD)
VSALGDFEFSEARLQDPKNRQNSIALNEGNDYLKNWWNWKQAQVMETVQGIYREALENGLAKEVARKVLPEGLTPSRLYMNGTIRSWLHYTGLRSGNGTQKEHTVEAIEAGKILAEHIPTIWKAYNDATPNHS